MNERIQRILRSKQALWCVVIVVFALAVFLRTYRFHDWLHFGNDQARDAALVENVVKNNASWPQLGSSMGNTGFLLGPFYYYFQIISVKLFGIGPDKLAYPDLLFNLLSIPLLYFFLKRYFNTPERRERDGTPSAEMTKFLTAVFDKTGIVSNSKTVFRRCLTHVESALST